MYTGWADSNLVFHCKEEINLRGRIRTSRNDGRRYIPIPYPTLQVFTTTVILLASHLRFPVHEHEGRESLLLQEAACHRRGAKMFFPLAFETCKVGREFLRRHWLRESIAVEREAEDIASRRDGYILYRANSVRHW
jgi:hypothetical protein